MRRPHASTPVPTPPRLLDEQGGKPGRCQDGGAGDHLHGRRVQHRQRRSLQERDHHGRFLPGNATCEDPTRQHQYRRHPDFSMNKVESLGAVRTAGQVITYTVDVFNTGNVDLSKSEITTADSYQGTPHAKTPRVNTSTDATPTSR